MKNILCIYNVITNFVSGYAIINSDTEEKTLLGEMLEYMFALRQNGNILVCVQVKPEEFNKVDLAEKCNEAIYNSSYRRKFD